MRLPRIIRRCLPVELRRRLNARRIRAIAPLARENAMRERAEENFAEMVAATAEMISGRTNAPAQFDRQGAAAPEKRQPGRQPIAMPGETHSMGPFSVSKAWSPPIPAGARSAAWEDVHRFAPGAKPIRDPHFGLMGQEPPLSFVCVICELEQTPIRSAEERACPYCGIRLKLHGTRLFWWRQPIEVAAWRP